MPLVRKKSYPKRRQRAITRFSLSPQQKRHKCAIITQAAHRKKDRVRYAVSAFPRLHTVQKTMRESAIDFSFASHRKHPSDTERMCDHRFLPAACSPEKRHGQNVRSISPGSSPKKHHNVWSTAIIFWSSATPYLPP